LGHIPALPAPVPAYPPSLSAVPAPLQIALVPIGLTMGCSAWRPAPRSCRFFWWSAPWLPVLGVIAAILALIVPAIPFILLGLMIWAIVRRRPSASLVIKN
jgi:hypothetical protein